MIGRYLRGEPTQEPTAYMAKLRVAYDTGTDEMDRLAEEALQAQRDGDTPEAN